MKQQEVKCSSYSINEVGDYQLNREENNNKDIEECMLTPTSEESSPSIEPHIISTQIHS